jgi:hypothetical protein
MRMRGRCKLGSRPAPRGRTAEAELQVLYSRPHKERLTFAEVKELASLAGTADGLTATRSRYQLPDQES